jgi:hypothetical protein
MNVFANLKRCTGLNTTQEPELYPLHVAATFGDDAFRNFGLNHVPLCLLYHPVRIGAPRPQSDITHH